MLFLLTFVYQRLLAMELFLNLTAVLFVKINNPLHVMIGSRTSLAAQILLVSFEVKRAL
jgi:hypothetical protein